MRVRRVHSFERRRILREAMLFCACPSEAFLRMPLVHRALTVRGACVPETGD